MAKQAIKFEPMPDPYIYGYETQSDSGLRIEVVRCYEHEWNVFLTRDGHVVARSIEEYRMCKDGYLSRVEAFRVARSLVAS